MTTKFHALPFIADKTLFKAVNFALALRKQGLDLPLAIVRAAKYYKVKQEDVARYVGAKGGRQRAKNKIFEAYQQGRDDGEKP